MTVDARPAILSEDELLGFVRTQRWFAGGRTEPTGLTVLDQVELRPEPRRLVDLLAEVRFGGGTRDVYQLLLGLDTTGERDGYTIAGGVYPALDEPSALGELLGLMRSCAVLEGWEGTVEFCAPDELAPGIAVENARSLGLEQSNSSVVVDEALIIKLYRRIEAGVNPELEMIRFLTSHGFANMPELHGWWLYNGPALGATLGIAQRFLAGAVDGWSLALEELPTDPERFLARVERLGTVIGEMHRVLASAPDDPAFAPEEAGKETLALLAATVDDEIEDLFEHLPEEEALEPINGCGSALRDLLDGLVTTGSPGQLIRHHGDLHLGQVLWSSGDWSVVDLEGEPARTLPERRLKRSPLRDVAGMLRSLAYATTVAGGGDSEQRARALFLDAYLAAVAPAGILPAASQVEQLISIFELEKVVYELRYELSYRPDWVHVPVAGIRKLLEQGVGVTVAEELERLVAHDHPDPHRVLGVHDEGGELVVRVFRPDAERLRLLREDDDPVELERRDPAGLFVGVVEPGTQPLRYRLEVAHADGSTLELDDPYAFPPTIGELDLYLIGEGRHERLYEKLGAHVFEVGGVVGTAFAVWAPNARTVSVVGDFNGWDTRLHPMRSLGSSGVWELFVPAVEAGSRYKFALRHQDGSEHQHADPLAQAAEAPPLTASIVYSPAHRWTDEEWITRRGNTAQLQAPISIYELHLGSWRQGLGYAELAEQVGAYVRDLGFTHVELLPVMEHPFGGSWGYQVTSFYAPTARFGGPDEFRAFVDALHAQGIGVILDWVPAHFPRDEWALARFDGSALYEHADPRRGAQPDWGTLVFNLGRTEVRNFLIASGLYWLLECHADGLRVDAVAAMLYLDYSRREGEWIPNEQGGRENLEAVAFLRELNVLVHAREPGVLSVAEESTSWPGVSRPSYLGGLGFGLKWNMGWMHDTLGYFAQDPVYRRYHHHELTFSMIYAFSENFVLPLSHDEVVHGKGSLLRKMPGDRWQQLANLRLLYTYMWAHPGKKLLFMGGELAQEREWSHDSSLQWELLEQPEHAGIQALVRDLNGIYRAEPALYALDYDPAGFRWLDANDVERNIIAFLRFAAGGERCLACVCNLSPVPREQYRIGLPRGGHWRELLNTDSEHYGGTNMGNFGGVDAEASPWQGQPHSALISLPPLGAVWLAPEDAA